MKANIPSQFVVQLMVKRVSLSDRGMTMIELLIVMFIITLLSAIALPSVLIFSNRARESEARSYVSTINKGQQAYHLQYGVFGNLGELSLGIPVVTNNYTYVSTPTMGDTADTSATPTGSMRGFAGRVWLGTVHGTATTYAITCEGPSGGVPMITGTTCP